MLDFIGIGLGPFNLSLASLLHQKSTLNYLFFEQKQQFDWHAGMQLPQTVLQVPFMADLVSMVDPTSPLSFLNYLKHQHRLYKFYFLEQPHIPRREYNHYCQWAADQIEQIRYQSTVRAIHPIRLGFEVLVEQDGITQRYRCRHLVIGTGNSPRLPNCLDHIKEELPDRCLHSADYMHHRDQDLSGNVVVLGSGQSAAEVFQDLLKRQAKHENLASTFELHWLTRSQGFFPMEYTPLGLEHFSPDYVSSFYQLDENTKQRLIQEQSLLYKGISARTIREIYQQLYHMTVAQKASHTHLHQHCELVDATQHEHDAIRLRFKHRLTRQEFVIDAQSVIAATGYQQVQFDFLKQLDPLIEKNTHGHWKVTEHYQIKHQGHGQIFVQNQEMHSHGVVTPDLGMGAFRAAIIANQLMGYKHYDVQTHECFQHFDLSQNPHITMVSSNLTHEKATDEDKLRITQTQSHQAKQHFYTSKNYYENTL